MTKNGVRAIREPSAIARLRMRRVVTECFRARARTLQIMKRFPGKPKRKTRLRIRAPTVVPAPVSTMGEEGVVMLRMGGMVLRAIFVICQRENHGKCF